MPKVLHDCVGDVKGKKGVRDAYAICTASLQRAGKMKKKKGPLARIRDSYPGS